MLHSVSFQMCHFIQYFLTLVYLVGIWVTQICQAVLFLNWGTLSTCDICEPDKTLLLFFLCFLHSQVIHKVDLQKKFSFSILHLYMVSDECCFNMLEEELPSSCFHGFTCISLMQFLLRNLGSAKDDEHMMHA